jgi:DivIVA domain-containing protein
MEWFIAVVIVAALGVAAVAAAGGLGGMAKEPVRDVYRQDLPDDRQLVAADINGLRFGTALRGYAMDQVDDILDRLGREIAERDELIARLRAGDDQVQPVGIAGSEERQTPAEASDDAAEGWSSGYANADPSGVQQPDEVYPDYR